MLRQLVAILLLVFLAVIGVNWPELPFSARLADVIFVPLAAAVVAMGAPRISWKKADLAVVIYLLGALPAIAVSTDQRHSLIELVRELYLVAIYVVTAIAVRHRFSTIVGVGLAAGGALLSIGGLMFVALQMTGAATWPAMGEVMQLPYVGSTLRLRALTASEAMLACVLTAAIPFAIAAGRTQASAWRALAAAIAAAAMLTFSHAIAGFAVAALIAMAPSLSRPALRRVAIAGVVSIVVIMNLAATVTIRSVAGAAAYTDASQFHHAVDQRQLQVGGTTITYAVMSYARIKQVAFRAFAEHPITGVGLDRFHTETQRAFNEGWLPSVYREIDPHSTLIGRLAECGLIGGVTLVLLWIAWAAMARDASIAHPGIGLAATAALSGLIVSSLNADVMNFRFLWVIAGLLRGLHEANGIAIASGGDAAATGGTD
jgi:hypothetical protein